MKRNHVTEQGKGASLQQDQLWSFWGSAAGAAQSDADSPKLGSPPSRPVQLGPCSRYPSLRWLNRRPAQPPNDRHLLHHLTLRFSRSRQPLTSRDIDSLGKRSIASSNTAPVPGIHRSAAVLPAMDFNSLKDQVSNLTLYDLKAGVRKVQNGTHLRMAGPPGPVGKRLI